MADMSRGRRSVLIMGFGVATAVAERRRPRTVAAVVKYLMLTRRVRRQWDEVFEVVVGEVSVQMALVVRLVHTQAFYICCRRLVSHRQLPHQDREFFRYLPEFPGVLLTSMLIYLVLLAKL